MPIGKTDEDMPAGSRGPINLFRGINTAELSGEVVYARIDSQSMGPLPGGVLPKGSFVRLEWMLDQWFIVAFGEP